MLDGFLQTIPSCDTVYQPLLSQNQSIPDLKTYSEYGKMEEISTLDGYLHSYPEYEEEIELCYENRILWKEIESANGRGIKILLLNIQLKDDSINELSEISSINKVHIYFTQRLDIIPEKIFLLMIIPMIHLYIFRLHFQRTFSQEKLNINF